jgi:PLP dependent protein
VFATLTHTEAASLMSEVAEAGDSITGRIATVREQIAAACNRAGRTPESVALIAVSKTHPPETIIEAAQAGIQHFGENRVEEAAKIALVNAACPGLTWHMIGHVQSRKARDVVSHYQWVHSVDSLKIAERYSRFAQEQNRRLVVLLEVNVSGEASKEGFPAWNWQNDASQRVAIFDTARTMAEMGGFILCGLMTIAPIVETMEQARPIFAAVRTLRDALRDEVATIYRGADAWSVLSMGMTDDYPVAIEEGATHVRIGRAIFGARSIGMKKE